MGSKCGSLKNYKAPKKGVVANIYQHNFISLSNVWNRNNTLYSNYDRQKINCKKNYNLITK